MTVVPEPNPASLKLTVKSPVVVSILSVAEIKCGLSAHVTPGPNSRAAANETPPNRAVIVEIDIEGSLFLELIVTCEAGDLGGCQAVLDPNGWEATIDRILCVF